MRSKKKIRVNAKEKCNIVVCELSLFFVPVHEDPRDFRHGHCKSVKYWFDCVVEEMTGRKGTVSGTKKDKLIS